MNDLGVVANLGSFARYANVLKRVQQTRSIDILTLGGSITAGGYFLEFVRLLRTINNLNVTYHNHGHGATEITCSLPLHIYIQTTNPNQVYIYTILYIYTCTYLRTHLSVHIYAYIHNTYMNLQYYA